MAPVAPIYTPDNIGLAFQLNWSLSIFLRQEVRAIPVALDDLREATRSDGFRILEHRGVDERAHQFFLSSLPQVAPATIIQKLKGRWQHLLRPVCPLAFRRNYHLTSVGAAEHAVLDDYVRRQPQRHALADSRIDTRQIEWQFHDPTIDLSMNRASAHGLFVHNLHLVLELERGDWCIESPTWERRRAMLVAMSRKKEWLLSRIGVVSNHLHLLLGCGIIENPRDVGLAVLNNLAYVDGMRPTYRFSFYVGTFGAFNREAIRRTLGSQARNGSA